MTEPIDRALELEAEIRERLLRLLQSVAPRESGALAELLVKQQAREAYSG